MSSDIDISVAAAGDIRALANRHANCLEGYYTSELGPFYLRHFFWPAVISDPNSKTFIARKDDEIVGFIICTLNSDLLKKRIMQSRAFVGNVFILVKSIYSQLVRASTIENIRSLFRRHDAALPDAELFLIGVDGTYHNMGIGRALMTEMAAYFETQNCAQSYLRVRKNNAPGVRLYENMGYRTAHEVQEMGDTWLLMVKT